MKYLLLVLLCFLCVLSCRSQYPIIGCAFGRPFVAIGNAEFAPCDPGPVDTIRYEMTRDTITGIIEVVLEQGRASFQGMIIMEITTQLTRSGSCCTRKEYARRQSAYLKTRNGWRTAFGTFTFKADQL